MAYAMYMKVEDVKGDSADAAHDGWIEVVSLSHGVSTKSSYGVSGQDKPDFRDLSITKRVDRASIPLLSKCLNNTPIEEITLEICRATGNKTTFMKIVVKNAFVVSIDLNGSASPEDPLPIEQVTFRYGQITWEYTETPPSGEPGDTFEVTYDIEVAE